MPMYVLEQSTQGKIDLGVPKLFFLKVGQRRLYDCAGGEALLHEQVPGALPLLGVGILAVSFLPSQGQ